MGDSYPKVKLAAAQVSPVFLDREATIEKACNLILEAGRNGAQIIGFPECFVPAFPHWYLFYKIEAPESANFYKQLFKNAVTVPSPATDKLCTAAKQAGVDVVIGINEKISDRLGTLYNSQLFISKEGKILGCHRKLVPTRAERLVYGSGDGSTLHVFPTEYGSIGGLICGEHTNSLIRFAMLAKGEKIHVASWPAFATSNQNGKVPKQLHSSIDFRVRNHAFEGKIFVISVTGIFSEEMKDTMNLNREARDMFLNDGGYSSIIGPRGEYLAEPSPGEKIIYAEADFDHAIEAKTLHDVIGHYNRFDIFKLIVNETSLEPVEWDGKVRRRIGSRSGLRR